MNKKQKKIGWWIVDLLTVASVSGGILLWVWNYLSIESFLTVFISPILLIGGFAFIVAKDEKDSQVIEKEPEDEPFQKKKQSHSHSDTVRCPRCGNLVLKSESRCNKCGRITK